MKIGIAITTTPKRKEVFALCQQQFKKYAKGIDIVVIDDTKGRGVAHAKNLCLQRLRGYDHIFLFDDDCFPIKDGWEKMYINVAKESGDHHFLYLKETPSIVKIGYRDGVDRFNNCGGCLMYISGEVIEKVGGFCRDYGVYGFEHAGYSKRIHLAGLTPSGEYLCPKGAGDYIYSMDYDFNIDWGVKVKMNIDPKKMKSYVEYNRKVYVKDIQTVYQPLESTD